VLRVLMSTSKSVKRSVFLADLHIHSRYSRATSKQCDLENLSFWAAKKGLTVLGTGDFTHPAWWEEIGSKLVPVGNGFFRLQDELAAAVKARLPASCRLLPLFCLQVEISTIYKAGDRTRKVHHLVYAPDLEKAEAFRQALDRIGNIRSDGRPILGLDSRDLLEITLESGQGCHLIPAHIWTPWFSAMGSKSGFDSIEGCYRDLSQHIFAVETGLSSDPAMNWQVSSLDRYRLVSNSDAHSPSKLAREACMFDCEVDYESIFGALQTGQGYVGTVEFYPEEGKYHLDGHRKCGIRLTPEETRACGGICPVCGKPLTVGVMHRVEELADRKTGDKPKTAGQVRSLVPLAEILSELQRVGSGSKSVQRSYESLIAGLGPELEILCSLDLQAMEAAGPNHFVEAIKRLRRGTVHCEAGYDGEYGRVRLFEAKELEEPWLFAMPAIRKKQETKPSGRNENLTAPAETELAKLDRPGGDSPGGGSLGGDSLDGDSLDGDRDNSWGGLDPEQLEAARSPSQYNLVEAGPGTGKTHTLSKRISTIWWKRDPAQVRRIPSLSELSFCCPSDRFQPLRFLPSPLGKGPQKS